MERINYSSGSDWEHQVGYSRAVRMGNIIEVAGTTATQEGKVIGENDPFLQTKFILEKIEKVLMELGAEVSDVIRTRIYVTDISQWQAIGRAHEAFFRDTLPAATMVEVKALVDPRLLVEIEVSAITRDAS